MKQKEIGNTIGHRVLAWTLLLTLGIGAIAAGIVISALGYQNQLIIIDSGDGELTNAVFCFAAISTGFALYILRGFSTRIWTPPIAAVLLCLGYALALLAFGVQGLFFLAGAGIVVNISGKVIRKSKRKDGA